MAGIHVLYLTHIPHGMASQGKFKKQYSMNSIEFAELQFSVIIFQQSHLCQWHDGYFVIPKLQNHVFIHLKILKNCKISLEKP